MRDFNHTVNVLVKAYLNDTLESGICSACAVGNIINANGVYLAPYEFWQRNEEPPVKQSEWLRYIQRHVRKDNRFECDNEEALRQINCTGYSAEELSRIESAFEEPNIYHNGDEYIFKGLMAVVDVLAEIHGISLEQKSAAKAMFVKENL